MQTNKILFLFFIPLITGCYIDDRCKGANMVCPDSFKSTFRIISKDNGRDLVFGAGSIYDNSKIKILSLQGGDTTFANYQPDRLAGNGYDSVLRFKIDGIADTLYIILSDSDVDTISVSYGLSEGRCCSYNSIRTLNYNNSGPIPNFNGTVEFKK